MDFIAELVVRAVNKQPKLFRYKDSLTIVLIAIVWIAAFALMYFANMPAEAAAAIGVVGNFAGALVVRLTPGAITPSMEKRLKELAEDPPTEPTAAKHRSFGSRLDQVRAQLGTK